MTENIMYPSEEEPVTTQQVRELIEGYVNSISETLTIKATDNRYRQSEVQQILQYLSEKSKLFNSGLLPADDHSFLRDQLEYWFVMAQTSAQYTHELEPSVRVIKHAVDAVQAIMIVNDMLDVETIKELSERWPVEDA